MEAIPAQTGCFNTYHNKGHILDLIIPKGLHTSEVVVTNVALSDHHCVFFKMTISADTSRIKKEIIRKCSTKTPALFTEGFTST